ncbi:MAG: helix-turn-helix domain-containing protein [Solirubrobacterales bacterium]
MRTRPLLIAPTLEERFALNLWHSRRRAGLSQEALSASVGLSRDAVNQLELGRRLPRLDTILQILAGTNVSACFLLEGMEWRPGRYVDGDFYVEHPAASLRRSVQR